MTAIQKPSSQPYQKIFLFDAIGALVTLLFFLFVLIPFQTWIGFPETVLYILASIAALFLIHSGATYFLVQSNWKRSLRLVIGGNIGYATLTASLLLLYSDQIQPLGYIYFIGEILVLVALVTYELSILRKSQ